MSERHPDRDELILLSDDELMKYCRLEGFRGRGPGGQHRNRRESGVRLVLLCNERIRAQACEDRSQHRNRKIALSRMRHAIALGWRKSEVQPWRGSLQLNPQNPYYALLIAHVLDAFEAAQWQIREAAGLLGLSVGKLSRIVTADTAVRDLVNHERAQLGMHPLRG